MLGTEQSGIVLVVPVDPGTFADGESLNVTVWNAQQLEALERNSRCRTVVDPQTNTELIQCPDGVQYEDVTPEEFGFPVGGIVADIELSPTSVREGETFRIHVSGLNRDGCNRTSARFTGVATGSRLVLDGLEWETTLRACPPG